MSRSSTILNFPLFPLSGNPAALAARVEDANHVALLLNFDGTLSEIAPRPELAVVSPQIRESLDSLAARPDFTVAVVSGRALDDVRQRTGLGHVIYVGNHGLEIEAGPTRFREPRAECLRRELRSLVLQLKLALSETEGVSIEDKGLTATVHFRGVPEHSHDRLRTLTCDIAARSRSFRCHEGNFSLEIRPEGAWNKAYAIRWILREVLPYSALPLYLGDDAADSDVASAIGEGITIRVGEPDDSRAQFYLPNVAAVADFLQWLVQAKSNGAFATSQRAGR